MAPQFVTSSTAYLDASGWRFNKGDGAVNGATLTTGSGSAPNISFGAKIDVGKSAKPLTVLVELEGPVEFVEKTPPLIHIGNGTTGLGMVMGSKTTLLGAWGNAYWNNTLNEAFSVPALAQSGRAYVALGTCVDDSQWTAFASVDPASGTVTWHDAVMRGTEVYATQINFGNFVNATSGGLSYTLRSVVVFAGRASNEELLAFTACRCSTIENDEAWIFKDVEGVSHQIVKVVGKRTPPSFTVNNTNTRYTLYGDEISGTTSLTKRGNGTLYLQGKNTFSGGVVIEGGTVIESGAQGTLKGTLGTGKKDSWASKLTLRDGVFDLNQSQNYRNNSDTSRWGWLSTQTLTFGGQARGVMEIKNGTFGIGAAPMIIYDATNNPGKATVSAAFDFNGASGETTRELRIADSNATDVEVAFTGGMHAHTGADGNLTTLNKTEAGTIKISCGFGFKGLQISKGTVLMGKDNAFMGSFSTLTLSGGTLDLGGTTQALAPTALVYTSGAINNGTLALSAGTCTAPLAGSADILATGVLSLTGTVSTTGTLRVAPGASLTLAAMPAQATIRVDCSPLLNLADGATWSPLTVGGEVDDARLVWENYAEGLMSLTRDENGTYTLTVHRDRKQFIVMPMGDSITEGSGNAENAPSYRKALAEQMMAAGMNPRFTGARIYKSTPIANENCRLHTGLSGQRVQTVNNRGGFLQGAPNWLEQAGYPDAITLMIGTNDLTIVEDTPRIFRLWQELIRQMVALRPNTWIIVSPITPTRSDDTSRNAYNEAYNSAIKGLFTLTESTLTVNGEAVTCVLGELNDAGKAAFGESAKVRLASMYDAIPTTDNSAYFYDSLHPSQAGYDRMAAVWLTAIKQLRGAEGGLADAETIVDAYQTADKMDSVTLVFNCDQASTDGFTLDGQAPASATLSADSRRITLTAATPFADGQTLTVARGTLSATVTIKAAEATSRVPSEHLAGYTKVKTLAVPEKGAYHSAKAVAEAFTTLPEAEAIQAFDRVGYYVTLARPDGQLRYLWVSMDAPYTQIAELGLPQEARRTKVGNLRVATNMPGIDEVSADGVEGLIQFGPHSLGTTAVDSEAPQSLGAIYDWNCTAGTTQYGYGYLQIFRLYPEGKPDSKMPASTLFAYNHWSLNDGHNDEILLGDLANHQQYAAGTTTASLCGIFTTSFPTLNTSAYTVRNIEVWVREQRSLTWAGAATGAWSATDPALWQEAIPFFDGADVTFGPLTDGTEASITLPEARTVGTLAITQNIYTFTGSGLTATGGVTVAADASATFASALASPALTVAGTLAFEANQAPFAAVTFAGGATFVANGHPLTCTDGVTRSGEGPITIAVPSATPFGLEPTVVISGLGSLTAADFSAPSGYTLAVTEAGALTLALTPPPKPIQAEGADADTTAWTAEAIKVIHELTGGIQPTTVTATTKAGTKPLSAAETSAALALFEDIATATEDGETVTVAYDFGIDWMALTGSDLILCAKVQQSDALGATMPETTTVTVEASTDDGQSWQAVGAETVAPPTGRTAASGTRYLRLAAPTRNTRYRIRASN
ncbi:MAG: GDSL-type esterase/lipase family protein [Candidatus Spyradenecus sp.]